MSDYIEKDDITTFPSDGCDCGDSECPMPNDEDMVLDKFEYLLDFDKMTDKEKYSLFMPRVVFVYTSESHWVSDDVTTTGFYPGTDVNSVIVKEHMNTGRMVQDIKYDFSHNGIPTAMITFKSILESRLPRGIRIKLAQWANEHYIPIP